MARPPGRDQNAPMERLVRLIGALTKHRSGAPLAVLLKVVAADDATDEARRKMLSRDLEHLNALGYDIRNVADIGSDGVYVMRARDNRLQVHLTPEQRGELLRAAIAAGLEGMATHLGSGDDRSARRRRPRRPTSTWCSAAPPGTAWCGSPTRASRGWCTRPGCTAGRPAGTSAVARTGGEVVKEFVVARMSDIALDPPGTADGGGRAGAPVARPAVVAGRPARRGGARRCRPSTGCSPRTSSVRRSAPRESGGDLALTYLVTNRQVFRYRIYELGTRVTVLSPTEVRAEIVAELRSFLGAPA